MVLTLSGRNYIMCAVESSCILAAAASSELSSTVSCGQVKSKVMPFSDD